MLGEHCPLLGQLILPKDSELACKDDGARNTNPGINLEDEPQLHRFKFSHIKAHACTKMSKSQMSLLKLEPSWIPHLT